MSALSATALLEQVGHDVSGAVQIAALGEVENVLTQSGKLEVVTNAVLGQRLRELLTRPSQSAPADEG